MFCTTALFTRKLDPTDVSRMAGHANYLIALDMYKGMAGIESPDSIVTIDKAGCSLPVTRLARTEISAEEQGRDIFGAAFLIQH